MIPRRLLLPLIALVLVLHALALGGAKASSMRHSAPAPPRAFETRTIALVAPPELPTATPTARPAVPAAPVTRKRRPRPLPAAAPVTTANTPEPPPEAWAPAPADWATPSPGELLALGSPAEGQEDAAAPPPTPALAEHSLAVPTPPLQDAESAATTEPASGKRPTPAPNAPVLLPPSTRLNFEVNGQAKGFGYHALAELLWQHDGASYHAHQEVKVLFLGSRSQDSVGSISALGLQPRRFADKSRSERAAHFDFASGQVTFSANTPPAAIEPGAQDRLSVFLQLSSMLAAAPERYPPGAQIAMTTVSARAADVWTFTVESEQSLDLPMGTVRAVPLQRLPRRDYDQKAQVWLAPSLGYLPVRIRLTEANGDYAELNLRSHEAP
ncbi:MAG: DUF3108 domain-containing protein [Giesbergeria sp.]